MIYETANRQTGEPANCRFFGFAGLFNSHYMANRLNYCMFAGWERGNGERANQRTENWRTGKLAICCFAVSTVNRQFCI